MKYLIYCTLLLLATIICISTTTQAQSSVVRSPIITTIAGMGACDGEQAQVAVLNSPRGIAMANDGMIIADTNNHRIRKVLNNGTIITIAGTGTLGYNGDNILAVNAKLSGPASAAVDLNGEIYFSELYNHRIRKVLNNGTIITIAGTGTAGYNGDNILATTAQLSSPGGLTLDSNGQVVFVDYGSGTVRKILTNGTIITLAGTGTHGYNGDNIPAKTAQLRNPFGVAVDSVNGEVYIADTGNQRIRKILMNGNIVTIAGTGTAGYNGDNILAISANIRNPYYIRLDPISGEVYFVDSLNQRIRKVLKNGIIITIAGTGTQGYNGDNILATSANLNNPFDVLKKDDGEILFVDNSNHRIRKILTNGYITTIVGTGSTTYCGEGILSSKVPMSVMRGVFASQNNEIYIADTANHRIRKIFTNGTIITIAGTGTFGYDGDNILAVNTKLNSPALVVVDSNGEIYIADTANHRIRKIFTNGTIITIAGTGALGYNGDNILATAAKLYNPYGVAVDSINGEVYIADTGNHRIRKIFTNGTIVTIAGTGALGYNGDNILATTAKLYYPYGVAVDSINSEVYIADRTNHRIRKILKNGIITTIAGTETSGYNGDNILSITARLNNPYSVTVNSIGEVFFTDTGNYRIRKILTNGTIVTIAGTGTSGYNGENILAITAQLNNPYGVSQKSNGEVLVTTGNYLRLITTNYTCVNNCNDNGDCIGANQCQCKLGYKGPSCSEFSCSEVEECNGKGSCTGPNECTCNSGWKGNDKCSAPSCDTKGDCYGNGVCSGPNTCTCNSGWKGNSDCSQPSCEGVNNCNGEGSCTGPNVCTCNSGWKGNAQCSAPSCDGVNDCSGKGTCSGPNTCTCNNGWKGNSDCSQPSCEGVNDCNGNGDCTGVNQCKCFSGYKGPSCSEYSCSNVEECNGNGVCTSPNVCTCNSGWKGNGNCSVLSCDAKGNCNGNGECTGPNECTCKSGWKGNDECTISSCDGLGNCNAHGTCIGANMCECISGWQGSEDCSLLSCDGVGNCTGHGTCTSANQCNCDSGWKGDVSCNSFTCEGVNNCNGNGICSGPNTCDCNSGWKGDAVCSTPSCDGVNNCNNQGTCTSPNNCTCNSGWKGGECSQPSCSALNNCNSNGVCVSSNTCTCNSGWKGNAQCSQYSCEAVNNCIGNGNCIGPNTCSGSSSATCQTGWKSNTFGAPRPIVTTSYNSDSKKFILNIEMFKNDLPDQNTFNSLALANTNNLDNSNCQTSDSNNSPFSVVSDGKCSKNYEYQFDTAELGSSDNFVGIISHDGNSLIYSSYITTSYSFNDINTNTCSLYQFTTKVQYQLSLVASQTEFTSVDNIGKFIVKRLYINSDKKFVLEGTLSRVLDKVSSFQDITLTKQNAPALTLSQSSSVTCGSACYNLIFTSDQFASESLDDTYKLQFKMSELPSDSNIPIENTRTLSIDIAVQYTVPVDPSVISGGEITSSITLYNSNDALLRPLISYSTNDKVFLGNAIDDVNIVLPTNTKFSPLNAKVCCVPSATTFPSTGCSGNGHSSFADLVVNKVVQQNVDVAIEGQDLNSKIAISKEYYLQFLIKDKLSNIPTSAQTCRIYIESTFQTLNSRNVERNELFSVIVKSQSQFNIVYDTITERKEMMTGTLITNNYYLIITSSVIVGSGLLLSLVIAILAIVYVYFQKKKNVVNNITDHSVGV